MKKRRFQSFARLRGSLFLLLSVMTLLSSCVTNRKYVLFQGDDLHKRNIPTDTVLRQYKPEMKEYHIQTNDLLYVTFESLTPSDYNFLQQSRMQGGMQMVGLNMLMMGELVDPDGNIQFPFIGKVKVAGLTVFEIQDKLQQIAEAYLDKPVVRVRLINFRFTVLGEVNREGTVNVQNNQVHILEALGLAGGLTDMADRTRIKLIRQVDGVTTVQYINVLDENMIHSPYYYLHQNDVLIVPPLRQRPFRRYFGQNMSIILSALSLLIVTITFYNNLN